MLTHDPVLQDLMKGAPDTPNVVEACNLEGRQERLDGLLGQLEMCEKALQASATCIGTHTWTCCLTYMICCLCSFAQASPSWVFLVLMRLLSNNWYCVSRLPKQM